VGLTVSLHDKFLGFEPTVLGEALDAYAENSDTIGDAKRGAG
jgi:hypothetical protein